MSRIEYHGDVYVDQIEGVIAFPTGTSIDIGISLAYRIETELKAMNKNTEDTDLIFKNMHILIWQDD